MRYGRTAAAAVAVFLAGACGGGAKAATDSARAIEPSTTTIAASTTTTTNADAARADAAHAAAAVLRASDLPATWVERPHTDSDSPSMDELIADCLHVPLRMVHTDNFPHAYSSDFKADAGTLIQAEITVFPTITEARREMAVLHEPNVASCSARSVDTYLGRPAIVTHGVSLTLPTIGAEHVAYRLSSLSRGVTLGYVDSLFALRGRAVAQVIYAHGATPPDVAFETALLQKMYDRLAATSSA